MKGLGRTLFGVQAIFLVVFLNTPFWLSLTESATLIHFMINVLCLYGLSLTPLVMLYSGLSDARRSSQLFLSLGIGLAIGAVIVLVLNIMWGSFLIPKYSYQLLVFAGLSVFLMIHDGIFFRFLDVAQKVSEGQNLGVDNWRSSIRFRRMMFLLNIYSIPFFLVLIISQNLGLAFSLLGFQVIATLVALRSQRFLVRWADNHKPLV